MPRANWHDLMAQIARQSEFDVSTEDFSDLEIRLAANETFYYFFHAQTSRVIKDFLLRQGPQVDTLCNVILTKKTEGFAPRLILGNETRPPAHCPKSSMRSISQPNKEPPPLRPESVSTIVTIFGSSLASSKPIRISIYPKMNFVLLMHLNCSHGPLQDTTRLQSSLH